MHSKRYLFKNKAGHLQHNSQNMFLKRYLVRKNPHTLDEIRKTCEQEHDASNIWDFSFVPQQIKNIHNIWKVHVSKTCNF